jgi:prepilin-type processing-associated H-X9-DG protein
MMLYDNDFNTFPAGKYNVQNFILDGFEVFRDDYNVVANIVYCPSSDGWRNKTSRKHWTDDYWTNETAGGRLGYYYLAGNGTRSIKYNGWLPGYFPEWDKGYFAPMSSKNDYFWMNAAETGAGAYPEHPSKTFMVHDLAYYSNTPGVPPSPHAYQPSEPSHRGGGFDADGANTLFLDSHVSWSKHQPGSSWKFAGVEGNGGWWSPPFPAPAGAAIMN